MTAPQALDTELVPVDQLTAHPENYNQGDDARLAELLAIHGQWRPAVVQRSTGRVLIGNTMLRAARDRLGWTHLNVHWRDVDDTAARKILAADNHSRDVAVTDDDALLALLRSIGDDLTGTGYIPDELDALLASLDTPDPDGLDGTPQPAAPTLAERFVVPPFTVLDARSGAWAERKRRWLALGIQSELGRAEAMAYTNQAGIADIQAGWGITATRRNGSAADRPTGLVLGSLSGRVPTYYAQKQAAETRLGRELTAEEFERHHLDVGGQTENLSTSGTSVFDPVLTELAVRWFSPPGGHVLDPFAGGSVRGLVTAHLGRSYEGVELRGEQVAANEGQRGLAPDGADLTWTQGDARQLPDGRPADLLLTCPPYAWLERYSDDPADLSTMSWEDFQAAHRQVIRAAAARLAPDRYAVWVVGEVRTRGGDGHSAGLIADTILAFRQAGLELYNEMIYVTPVGSTAVRVGRAFTAGRKVGRTHQHVLVFIKGDGMAAARACGTVDVELPDPEVADADDPELPDPAEEATEPGSQPPAWAKGYPVERLRQITALFHQHDTGMIHGAYGRYGEVECAADLERGRLHLHPPTGPPQVAWVGYTTGGTIPVRDFTGRAQPPITAGAYYVPRMAWSRDPAELRQALRDQDAVAVWAWQEHPGERDLMAALDLEPGPVKISAASEVRCLYRPGRQVTLDPADATTIGPLALHAPEELRAAVLHRFTGVGYAQHYSGYNRRSSWAAVALRGYWPDDPDRIEKPAEMSRRWRLEHPEALTLTPADTPLMGPDVAALLDLIPAAGHDRVRLMRLQPGGGELTRHADITDPDAGAVPGKAARIHIPLVTNPDCLFRMWDLDGRELPCHMAPGGVYYLDTRKPHTALNAGAEPRIHLVADCRVTEELRQLIAAAGQLSG